MGIENSRAIRLTDTEVLFYRTRLVNAASRLRSDDESLVKTLSLQQRELLDHTVYQTGKLLEGNGRGDEVEFIKVALLSPPTEPTRTALESYWTFHYKEIKRRLLQPDGNQPQNTGDLSAEEKARLINRCCTYVTLALMKGVFAPTGFQDLKVSEFPSK